MKISDYSYEMFSTKERFNLALAAMARNDEAETDKLWRTAPVTLYRARDLDYKGMMLAITLITSKYFEFCVFQYNKIQFLELVLFVENNPEYAEVIDKVQLEKIPNERMARIAKLKAVKEGLIQSCNEVGLDAENVLKTVNLTRICFDIDEYMALNVPTDKEYAVEIKNEFLKYWHFKN